MSSDGKEPGAIWQGPTNSGWRETAHSLPVDAEELPPLPAQQQAVVMQTDPPGTGIVESELEEDDAEQATRRPAILDKLIQYATLILAPLLFGALTSLFVLPLVASGRASLPPEGFWPITLVIIAIALAQAVAVYYAGSNNGMWVVGTVAGFLLFLLVGCFSIFGPLPGLILLVIILGAAIGLARYCLHSVPEGYVAITSAFGKYSRTLYPGLNVLLPWEKATTEISIAETQWICPPQKIQLSHDEDVILRAVISYQVMPEDALLAVTRVKAWEESLRQLFVATLQTVATVFVPEDFLIWPHGMHAGSSAAQGDDDFNGGPARREKINNFLFQQIRDKVALWGIQINWVRIQNIELAPHDITPFESTPVVPKQAAETFVTQKSAPPVPAQTPQAAVVLQQEVRSTPKRAEQQVPVQQVDYQALPKIFKEDVLVKVYKEVQNGKITDPETIRGYAASFDAVARDPKASQTVSFDPARAALNLYEQARRYEEHIVNPGGIYDDTTKSDWPVGRSANGSLSAEK